MIYKASQSTKSKLFAMFSSIEDTVILSCLQGHMGEVWVDNLEVPAVAQVIMGDFVAFAGNPNAIASKELLLHLPAENLVIVGTDEWKMRLETVHNGCIEKVQRYKFRNNINDLDREHIQTFISTLPKGYELRRIDATIASKPSLHRLSEDFTGQFKNVEDYISRGIGFAILYKGKVVCGASSYSIYDDGIEIEIETHRHHRRKGLATIAASALILECLDRQLYPSWDAANLISVRLAEKLGYVLDRLYDAYYIDII